MSEVKAKSSFKTLNLSPSHTSKSFQIKSQTGQSKPQSISKVLDGKTLPLHPCDMDAMAMFAKLWLANILTTVLLNASL